MKKIVSVLFGLTVFAVMSIPVFAVTDTKNFSFTMDLRVVDGEKNGQIHTLHDGVIQLDGTMKTVSQDSGWTNTPTKVKISLWEQDGALSSDDYIGYVEVNPSSILGGTTSFSKNFGSIVADGGSDTNGEYYLYLEKSFDDNWNLSGSGTLKSTY